MNAGAKLGAYGLVLAAVFGIGAAVGAAVGPIDVGGAGEDVEVDVDVDAPDEPGGHGDGHGDG